MRNVSVSKNGSNLTRKVKKQNQRNQPAKETANSMFDAGIVNSIGKNLLQQAHTIAVAESVTAGFVQAALSSATDAVQFFQGGITTYNLGQKSRHLHIEPVHAQSCNCVSQQVADQMALEVCNLFSSHWGLAITGYASPVPESNNTVFAFYAIANNGKIVQSGKIEPDEEEPVQVQLLYTLELLTCLNSQLSHTGQ